MDFKDLAWNNFYKTGDIQSFLEYRKLNNIYNVDILQNEYNSTQQIMQNFEEMINEVNKSQGDSNKGSSI